MLTFAISHITQAKISAIEEQVSINQQCAIGLRTELEESLKTAAPHLDAAREAINELYAKDLGET